MAEIEEKVRPKRHRLRTKLLLLLAAAALLAGMFVLGAVLTHRDSAPQITGDVIEQQLRNVQELATVEYYYTNMGRFENQVDFYGWKVPFTRKSFIVSYDGIIKAGVDLSQIAIEVADKNISLKLPTAKILSHEIPEDSLEIFDETSNVFNPIQIQDYTGFTRDQKAEIEAKVLENGLLTRASEKAADAVRALLALLPEMEDYTVQIR